MPRPTTRGLDYTFLDKNFFFDRKVKRLKRKCGNDSPLVFIALLCLITPEGYYVKYDNDIVYDIADMTGFDEDKVSQVLDACGEVGLLDEALMKTERVLTSHGIQKYYAATCAQLKRKSGVEEYSLLNDKIEAVSPEETPISPEETGVNSEFIPTKEKKRKEINKDNNITSSLVPSSSTDESVTEKEQEQERFVYFFTFDKNYPSPNYEYQRMVAYNSTPAAKKKWDQMTDAEKQAILFLWHPEKEDGKQRYGEVFLQVWQKVYQKLQERGAPYAVRMAALSDNLTWKADHGRFYLYCPEVLYEWIEIPIAPETESNLRFIKPILWPLMQQHGCKDLMYQVVK